MTPHGFFLGLGCGLACSVAVAWMALAVGLLLGGALADETARDVVPTRHLRAVTA